MSSTLDSRATRPYPTEVRAHEHTAAERPASYGGAARAVVAVLFLLLVSLWATLSVPSFLGILGAALG